MKKYNKQIIFDYVNGNDIEGYDIDELENDCEFMIEVIKYSNDKNIYNLCSDEIKTNFKFVKFLLETFKTDKKFVEEVAETYYNQKSSINELEDIELQEFYILMCNIFKTGVESLSYHLKLTAFYIQETAQINSAIDKERKTNPSFAQELGKGFVFIKDKYENSTIIKDFFAKKMINEIFCEETNRNLEEALHMRYKKAESINREGVNKFILQYIEGYDSYLANYVGCNINLIDNIKKEINRIINHWDKYIDNINCRRVAILYQEIPNYMENFSGMTKLGWYQMMRYAIRKLKLEETFNKYDDNTFLEELELDKINEKNMNICELTCLNYIMTLIKELYKFDKIPNNNNDYDNKKKQKAKVLQIDFSKEANKK